MACPRSSTNSARNYFIAVAGVILATATRLALDPWLGDRFPFFAFFVAVVIAAWYGGFGPAILAVCLSLLAIDRFLLVPRPGTALRRPVAIGPGLLRRQPGRRPGRRGLAGRSASAQASDLEARRVLEEQRADRERLLTTLASIADAVITTDPEGRITSLNPAAERLTGWGTSEADRPSPGEVFRIVEGATDLSSALALASFVPRVRRPRWRSQHRPCPRR